MEYLLSGDTQYGGDSRFESFNTNIICWDDDAGNPIGDDVVAI